MPFKTPTTAELVAQNLSNIESKTNTTTPANNKAFNKVVATLQAAQQIGLYKFAAERILQNLALTATGDDLTTIGNNYGVTRRAAEAATFTATLPAVTDTIIPINVDFVGDANGIRYSLDAAVTAVAGVATLQLTAQTLGTAGNLNVSDTLTIGRPVVGAESTATITVITNTGAEEETDDEYRSRVLNKIRTIPGGGNSADYRIWSEEVAGVDRAYPFAALPIGFSSTVQPPQRTVYIEATTSIDPDGIAPQSLLDEVRESITADPDTGITRQPLGLTDDTLFVETITRTTFFVTITDLVVDANQEAQVKSDISDALDLYFRATSPYVEGLDSPLDKNDVITSNSVSEVVNNVVRSAGGNVSTSIFGLSVGADVPKYQLNQNELAKNGGVTYV